MAGAKRSVPRGGGFDVRKPALLVFRRDPVTILDADAESVQSDLPTTCQFISHRQGKMKWSYCVIRSNKRRLGQAICAAIVLLFAACFALNAFPSWGGWIFATLFVLLAIRYSFRPPGWTSVIAISSVLASSCLVGDFDGHATSGSLFVIAVCGSVGLAVGVCIDSKIEDREFLLALGDEVGPEACRREGCERKRIRLGVLCRRHHFEMMRIEHPEVVNFPYS